MARTEPNAIAVCGSVSRAAAVCATAATTIIPTAARSSSRPESMACHDGSRSSASRIATGSSCGLQTLDDPERRRRVVMVLCGHGLPVGGGGGALGGPPAFPVQRGDEGLNHDRIELAASAPAQFLDRLAHPARLPVRAR